MRGGTRQMSFAYDAQNRPGCDRKPKQNCRMRSAHEFARPNPWSKKTMLRMCSCPTQNRRLGAQRRDPTISHQRARVFSHRNHGSNVKTERTSSRMVGTGQEIPGWYVVGKWKTMLCATLGGARACGSSKNCCDAKTVGHADDTSNRT